MVKKSACNAGDLGSIPGSGRSPGQENDYHSSIYHNVVNWLCAVLCSVTQLCLCCDPMDCSPPGSSAHGVFQVRILGGLPFPSPGDLPNPGTEPMSPESLVLQEDFLPLSHLGSLIDFDS